MFLVVMLLLWTLVTAVVAGNGKELDVAVPAAAIYGLSAGYWIIAGFALFDHMSREFVTGGASRFLFALFAVPFLMSAWPFVAMGPVSPLPPDLQFPVPAPVAAAPFLCVMLCYLVRPDRALPPKTEDAGAS